MFEINITRWNKTRTFVEIMSSGKIVYAKEYETDISDNPEIGVDLIKFVDYNKVKLSTPITVHDFREIKERTYPLRLKEIKDFVTEFRKEKGH